MWAEPRATFDLDVLAGASQEDESRLRNTLRRARFHFWSPPTDIRLPIWSLHTGEKPRRVYLDLYLSRDAYQSETLRRRRSVPFGSGRIAVLSPEDLLIHKLLADRDRDRGDVASLLAIRREGLDWSYVRRWTRALGLRLPRARARKDRRPGGR